MASDEIINIGAPVEFKRKSPSGNDIPTKGWVTNVVGGEEYNCTYTYLVIEYYAGKTVAIHHARLDDVKILTKKKEKK